MSQVLQFAILSLGIGAAYPGVTPSGVARRPRAAKNRRAPRWTGCE